MLKPCLPVTSTIKGLRGSFQTWHDLEVKGRQAQSPGHKYLPTHSSLRALGGPGLRLGGTPINPPADRLSLCPPCHRAFLGAAAASAAPSGGRDKLRSWSEGRSRGWCGRVSEWVSGWEQGEQARPSAGWGAEPPASLAGGQSTDTTPCTVPCGGCSPTPQSDSEASQHPPSCPRIGTVPSGDEGPAASAGI